MSERLLALLRSRADHRGIVMVRGDLLLRELDASRGMVTSQLASLERSGILEVLSPFPFFVLKLVKWSGQRRIEATRTPDSRPSSSDSLNRVPVSSSDAAAAAFSKQEDGGAGEGEVLLEAVLAELGPEQDAEVVRELLARYPVSSIRRALRRVQETPPGSIRKSKAALFRYLLDRLP